MTLPDCFIHFSQPTEGYPLPARFTFPFHYTPHRLCLIAAEELQQYIENEAKWQHNFGFDDAPDALGKMFGVLVVESKTGTLGYIAAFSGKIGGSYEHENFVPPVFNMLEEEGFYRQGEEEINKINRRIEAILQNTNFLDLKKQLETLENETEIQLKNLKINQKNAKATRDERRKTAQNALSATEFAALETALNKESAEWHFCVKDAARQAKRQIESVQIQIAVFQDEINLLKEKRKTMSGALQQQLFEKYTFLNKFGNKKSVYHIFGVSDEVLPPSGAGECAAPKLLQYAFLHDLRPVAIAEFWWGQSPSSEIRKHKHFYPACKSKCEPILKHMLEGIEMDENPMLQNPAEGKTLPIIYEDDYIIVVNKPAEFLAVPGKKIDDSVYTRIKNMYPQATGPLIVHRLDMSTSGLMLIAKTKEIHQNLQSQFIKRKVQKRYTALLKGILEGDEGFIDLPLRVDLDNRPYQLVCFDYGKPAQTRWKIAGYTEGGHTKIHFYPITGRTHQLRVHAAHIRGLNMPIVGDDLYGTRADRLYLHAAALTFTHPITEQLVTFEIEAIF